MRKYFLVNLFLLVFCSSSEAQLLNKLKNKVSNAVNNAADKNANKAIDKTVTQPIDEAADKALEKKETSPKKEDKKPAEQASTRSTTKPSNDAQPVPTQADANYPPLNMSPELNVVNRPSCLAIDSKDNLFVIDADGIIRIAPDGSMKRVSGTRASNIVIDAKDNIYLGYRGTIQRLLFDKNGNSKMEYMAGDDNYDGAQDGDYKSAKFKGFSHMAVDKNGVIYIADNAGFLISRTLGEKSGKVYNEPGVPAKLDRSSYWYYIRKVSNGQVSSLKDAKGNYVMLMNVAGMAVDDDGNIVYSGGGFSRAIQKLDVSDLSWSTIAGKPYKREWCPVYITGDTSKAELFDPGFILLDKKGAVVFSDNRNHRITKIERGIVSTLAGSGVIEECSANMGGRAKEGHKDGKAAGSLFNFPKQMVYDSKDNLFIIDSKNSVIRKLSPDGMVSSYTPFDRSKADISN